MRESVGFIGIVTQFGGSVLLIALFYLLRRHGWRRSYFTTWAHAWIAVTTAIGALLLRYAFYPMGPDAEQLAPVRSLYVLYQLGKLVYLGLLVAGTAAYARGAPGNRALRGWIIGSGVFSVASVVFAADLNWVVTFQTLVAVAALLYCAQTLIRLPAPRRTLGSRVTASIFALIAAVWAVYSVSFGTTALSDGGATVALLSFLPRYNSYFDVLLQMLLGYGMVVIYMEDARREVVDAHAELAVAHDRLRRLALYDGLTGCLNRRAFDDGIGLESARSTFGAVMVFDLDNLKEVNDQHGHAGGDDLLAHVAHVLRAHVRPLDRLYRWGGDEFLLVMPNANAATAEHRIGETLAGAPAAKVGEGEVAVKVEVSVGVSGYVSGAQLESAIETADARMYAQKRARKGVLASEAVLPVSPASTPVSRAG